VPIVILALVAVVFLLPESRSDQRPRLDILGVILSSAGLAGLTYGFIKAGQNGWTDAAALGTIAAGVVVLAVFVAWERWLTQRSVAAEAAGPDDRHGGRAPGIRPLVELRLFRSAGFTWGTILATFVSFAMFGILFAMPQYFQEVRGVNAMGSGLRLLPMIGGMVIGMIGGTRLASARRATEGKAARAPMASVKLLVTVGFTVMALALAFGAMTKITSGTGFAAAWFAVFGLGLGTAMPQTMNAALSALSAERSGSGSALISALRQVGATIGVAVLGTVLNSVYRSHLIVTGLPAATAAAARNSVVAGVEVAHALRSVALLASARSSFVHGLDAMLWACGGIALVSAVLALLFLPRRNEGMTTVPAADAALPVATGESDTERAELEV
jgi:DHA2 family multidrug resistance protein-like MFS transporter